MRARSFILQPIQRLKKIMSAERSAVCWMHPYVTWEQTLITWSLRTFIHELKDKVEFHFHDTGRDSGEEWRWLCGDRPQIAEYTCDKCIISAGRSGSKWMEGRM